MQNVIIITPQRNTLKEFVEKIPSHYSVEKQEEDRYLIQSKDYHGWIDYYYDFKVEYELEIQHFIYSKIPNPKFINIESSNPHFIKELVPHLIFDPEFIVDNTCWEIMSGKEFLQKLNNEPNWEWWNNEPLPFKPW